MEFYDYIRRVFGGKPELAEKEHPESMLLVAGSGLAGSKTDELCGRWHSEDDGSGLHYVWGSALELNEDGTGTYSCWGDTDSDNCGDFPVSWSRTGKHKLKIRFSVYSDWETLHYTIIHHDGPHGSMQLKLTDDQDRLESVHKEGFWIIGGGLFREQ
jgi:hypothetical protein